MCAIRSCVIDSCMASDRRPAGCSLWAPKTAPSWCTCCRYSDFDINLAHGTHRFLFVILSVSLSVFSGFLWFSLGFPVTLFVSSLSLSVIDRFRQRCHHRAPVRVLYHAPRSFVLTGVLLAAVINLGLQAFELHCQFDHRTMTLTSFFSVSRRFRQRH